MGFRCSAMCPNSLPPAFSLPLFICLAFLPVAVQSFSYQFDFISLL